MHLRPLAIPSTIGRPLALAIPCTLTIAVACGGDDGDTTGPTDGPTSAPETSVSASGTDSEASSGADSGSTSGSSGSGSTDTGADASTGGADVACGDTLVCTAGDVCIEDVIAPTCTNLEDPRGMCPPGQRMTFCGGAGIPCCCDPPPPSEFRCVAPVGCVGPADCTCLGEVCTEGRECTAQGSEPASRFRCEEPALP
jgi:hypothetical protein